MLDPLGGTNKGKIGRYVLLCFAFFHNLLAFFHQTHHAFADLRTGRFAKE